MAGLSFLPSDSQSPEDRSSASALTPGQSAISTIALNLPKILGVRPLTNSSMLGGGATGATHTGVDPNQIVLQALMRSAMSTPASAPMAAPSLAPNPTTTPMVGVSSSIVGTDEELRRRLAEMFGSPSAPATTPGNAPAPVQTPTPAPIFTPGLDMHINNAAPNLRPVTGPQTMPGDLRK